MERSTYLIRRLEFEWLDGDRAFASSAVDYADVPVAGSALRLPTVGRATLDARGPASALVSGATSEITFTYGDFAPARPR